MPAGDAHALHRDSAHQLQLPDEGDLDGQQVGLRRWHQGGKHVGDLRGGSGDGRAEAEAVLRHAHDRPARVGGVRIVAHQRLAGKGRQRIGDAGRGDGKLAAVSFGRSPAGRVASRSSTCACAGFNPASLDAAQRSARRTSAMRSTPSRRRMMSGSECDA